MKVTFRVSQYAPRHTATTRIFGFNASGKPTARVESPQTRVDARYYDEGSSHSRRERRSVAFFNRSTLKILLVAGGTTPYISTISN